MQIPFNWFANELPGKGVFISTIKIICSKRFRLEFNCGKVRKTKESLVIISCLLKGFFVKKKLYQYAFFIF